MRTIAIIPFILGSYLIGSVSSSLAAQLSIQFSNGGSEVTLMRGQTVRLDLIWTMQPTDKQGTLLSGVNLRFNVNDVADPDGTDRNDAFIIDRIDTFIPGWSTDAASGVGGFFSEFGLFLSAIHPDAVLGVVGNGTEFSTVIASFELRQAKSFGGETYITLRHNGPYDILPDATQDIGDGDGNFEWFFRWQEDVSQAIEFDLGVGNPGDGGPQWGIHGLEIFDPLIIHSIPGGEDPVPDPPGDDDGDDQPADDEPADDGPAEDEPADDEPATSDSDEDDPVRPPYPGGGGLPGDPSDGQIDDDFSSPAYEPPDRDADGVPKEIDRCPQTPRGKAVDGNGCSIDDPMRPLGDADRDGVADKDDDCPRTQLGRAADDRGCSYEQRDDDGDGVKNAADLCDDTPLGEPINRRGCPASRTDADSDTIADAYDLCPDSPSGQDVDGSGCTADQAAALDRPATRAASGGACGALGMIPILGFVMGGLALRRGARGA